MKKETRPKIAVIGGGKIGEPVVALLASRYDVTVFDQDEERLRSLEADSVAATKLDARDESAVKRALHGHDLVLNCCPHFCNLPIARAARSVDISYCDLSEDVKTGLEIEGLARGASGYFVPRCGLAPGFIQIVASFIISDYDSVDEAELRVGALPENPTNALKYNLTWSTDGLINEYSNPCEALVGGEISSERPLEGYERLVIDGVEYEAFNTSGGLGTLARSMLGKVRNLSYKTLRYIGHRDLMKFLLFELRLSEYRSILKQILESAVPSTRQDLVVILVSVVGVRGGILQQQTYTKTLRQRLLDDRRWTAIQLSTAAAAAAVADLALQGRLPHTGYVRQEEIDFEAFCGTPFGRLFCQ